MERQVEVLEVHCWGLRDGVKIQVEGFVEDGKLIKRFHTFTRDEQEIVRGEVKTTTMAKAVHEVMYKNGLSRSASKASNTKEKTDNQKEAFKRPNESELDRSAVLDGAATSKAEDELREVGTGDVVFRPSKRVVLPTNDINIDIERRNKAAFDVTMVTAVAHVWFNAFFEGNGPEQNGVPDASGVFEIKWDAMDGIKGSSRKGTQAFEKIAVVWKTLLPDEGHPGTVITEPKEGEEVKQSSPADWHGRSHVTPSEGKDIGLRMPSPTDSSTSINKDSSSESHKVIPHVLTTGRHSEDSDTKEVKAHGPNGEDVINEPSSASGTGSKPESANFPVAPSQDEGADANEHT